MSDKPITYTDDTGIVYYRASAFGTCPRALYASRKGYDPFPYPAPVLTAFAYGHENEQRVIERYEQEYEVKVRDRQREVSFKCGPVILIGHIDGTVADNVLDVKCLSADNYSKWLKYGFSAFPTYAWQLSIYQRAIHAAGITMVTLNKDTDDLHVSQHNPPHSFTGMLERIIGIETAVANGNQPSCEPTGFFCPFNYLDDTMFDTVELSGGMDQIRQNELWSLANEYRSYKRKESEFGNRAKEILHTIECRLREDERSIRVRKTGARTTLAIARVNQKRSDIDKELLGQYLQRNGSSLTLFERSKDVSFIRVSEVQPHKTDQTDTTDKKEPDAAPTEGE